LLAGQNVQQVELNGDGIPDLIALALQNSGELHVWYGGPSTATPRTEDAKLTAPPAANFKPSLGAQWQLFHDVTGDGQEDVVAVAPLDSSVAPESGAIHVFKGGAGLVGAVTPIATLRLGSAQPYDHLGDDNSASFLDYEVTQCVEFRDVTGDGIDDVICAAPAATRGGISQTGAIGVWAGGPGLSGTVLPLATLEAPVPATDLGLGEFPPSCASPRSIRVQWVPRQKSFAQRPQRKNSSSHWNVRAGISSFAASLSIDASAPPHAMQRGKPTGSEKVASTSRVAASGSRSRGRKSARTSPRPIARRSISPRSLVRTIRPSRRASSTSSRSPMP